MKDDIDVNVLKALYDGEQLSVSEVGKRLGVSWHIVYDRMNRYGLKRRSRSDAQKLRFERNCKGVSTEEILRLYFHEELSTFKVAERVGLSQSTVRDRIQKAGYALRSLKETRAMQNFRHSLIVFSEEQQSEIRHLYCEEKVSLAMIGFRFEVSPQIIKRNLVDMGVRLRTFKESQRIRRNRELEGYEKRLSENVGEIFPSSEISECLVIKFYKDDKLSLDEVALKCSLSRVDVYKILMEAGLVPVMKFKEE